MNAQTPPEGTLYARFCKYAVSQPDDVAILSPGRPDARFGEVHASIERNRTALYSHGLGRRSRIGLLIGDRNMQAGAHLLAVCCGTSVPLSSIAAPEELLATIEDMRIDGLLVGGDLPASVLDAARRSGKKVIQVEPGQAAGLLVLEEGNAPGTVDTGLPEPGDVAVLLYTSGTTSRPKIVPQKQSNRYAAISRNRGLMAVSRGDRSLNMMPLHHTQGLNAEFLTPLMNGGSAVVAEFDPDGLARLVEEYRPTWFNLVPAMHQVVLARFGDAEGIFRDTGLRFTRSSSAKLVSSLRTKLEKLYGIPVIESYGATETSHIASTGVRSEDDRPGSVGKPIHAGVTIVDPGGSPVPTGSEGEICVSGPTVIDGYENNPKANAVAFIGGAYRTGDVGYFDEDGFLYVTGRIHEVVNRGGEKFSLIEIDDAILQVDGVAEGAAFTLPHQQLGQEVHAAVVPAAGIEVRSSEVRAALSSRLSWARMPKRVLVLSELPKNETGKVLRGDLAERLKQQDGAGS